MSIKISLKLGVLKAQIYVVKMFYSNNIKNTLKYKNSYELYYPKNNIKVKNHTLFFSCFMNMDLSPVSFLQISN